MKLKAFESMERCKKLEEQVRRKDQRLRGQHNELVGLGQLKSEADKYHHETAVNLGKNVKKLKKENANLHKQIETLRQKQNNLDTGAGIERDEARASVKKKLKSMVMPIRGGGKKKKRNKKKKTNKKHTNDNNLNPAPAQYNHFHAKSPSMMSTGYFPTNQPIMYQPSYDMQTYRPKYYRPRPKWQHNKSNFEVGPQMNDGFPGDIPDIPSLVQGPSGVPYYNNPQMQIPMPHGRGNTFMDQTSFWPATNF